MGVVKLVALIEKRGFDFHNAILGDVVVGSVSNQDEVVDLEAELWWKSREAVWLCHSFVTVGFAACSMFVNFDDV